MVNIKSYLPQFLQPDYLPLQLPFSYSHHAEGNMATRRLNSKITLPVYTGSTCPE